MIYKCCKWVFLQKSGNKAKNSDTETRNPPDNYYPAGDKNGNILCTVKVLARVPVGLDLCFWTL